MNVKESWKNIEDFRQFSDFRASPPLTLLFSSHKNGGAQNLFSSYVPRSIFSWTTAYYWSAFKSEIISAYKEREKQGRRGGKIIKHMLHIACQDCAEFNKKWQSNGNKFCNFYTRFRESLKGRRRLSVGQIQCTPPMPLASQQALCIKRSANNADFVSYWLSPLATHSSDTCEQAVKCRKCQGTTNIPHRRRRVVRFL